MSAIRLFSAVALATIPVGCGSSGTCEDGTVQMGGTCYAHDPNDVTPPVVTVDPPVRTRAVGDVRLTTDEHATIYYSTDGTPANKLSLNEQDHVLIPGLPDDASISFFAVDVNGNASPVQTVHWEIDRNGPGAPMPFNVEVQGDMRTVTWTPPADPRTAGVLVARVEGVLTGGPESGRRYVPGNVLAPGVTVVAAVAPGFTGKFTETKTAAPGLVRYVAWSYDDLGNYGPPAGGYALTTVPAQTGSVQVASATGSVVATVTPSNTTFAGSATLDSSTLTVTLDVTNNTSRTLFAPKLLLTNTPGAATFDNSDGTFDTHPYRALGAAIPPGGKATTTIELGNVTSGDNLSLELDLRNGNVFVAGHWDNFAGSVVDEATEERVLDLAPGKFGPGGNSSTFGGGVTVDGFVVMGARTNSELSSFDLSTGKRVMFNRLGAGKSSVRRVILDPSGTGGYALYAVGHPYAMRFEGGPSQLVTFDASTLVERGRIDIGISRNRDMALSPDGRWLAISTGLETSGIVVVDLGTLRVARTLTSLYPASTAVFSPDGASLIAVGGDRLEVYSTSDWTVTKAVALPAGGKSFHAVFGPDGRLWVGREGDLVAIDVTTGVAESFAFDGGILESFGGKVYAADEGDSDVRRIDTSGVEETSLGFNTSIYGHWVGHSPF